MSANAIWLPTHSPLLQPPGTEMEGYRIGQIVKTQSNQLGEIIQIERTDWVMFLTLSIEGEEYPVVVYDDEVETVFDPFILAD